MLISNSWNARLSKSWCKTRNALSCRDSWPWWRAADCQFSTHRLAHFICSFYSRHDNYTEGTDIALRRYTYIFTHFILQISRNINLKKAVTNRTTPKEGLFRDWTRSCELFPNAVYSCKARLSIARNQCGCRRASCLLELRGGKESGKVVEVQMMHQTHCLCKYNVVPTFSVQG